MKRHHLNGSKYGPPIQVDAPILEEGFKDPGSRTQTLHVMEYNWNNVSSLHLSPQNPGQIWQSAGLSRSHAVPEIPVPSQKGASGSWKSSRTFSEGERGYVLFM